MVHTTNENSVSEDDNDDTDVLFKQPPRNEDCPICCIPLPSLKTGTKYNACCGKVLCSGCIYAGDSCCPFCRAPDSILVLRNMKRVKVGDAEAVYNLLQPCVLLLSRENMWIFT